MIEIDVSAPEPIYEQIVSQLGLALNKGLINEGEKLPPIRQLASDLEVNPNTVAKAYQALEEQNIIKGHGRSGSTIQPQANEKFNDWLLAQAKQELSQAWNKILALSPTKEIAKSVWKKSTQELRNE